MQKKLLITLLTIILIVILTVTVHISFVNASPVIFNMDTLPENQGWTVGKQGNVTSYVSNGILTIENNGGSLGYSAPADWRDTVNNTKGWIVEFRLKLEQGSYIKIDAGGRITFTDHYIAVDNTATPGYSMNTNDDFHVYRLVGQGSMLRIFVDEKLVLNGPYSYTNFPRMSIAVGGYDYSKSYWDYISYDTNPNERFFTTPTLTVVDGSSSYYISNLTGVTLDNSLIPIPNGIYAGWCVDKSTVMIRSVPHNVTLYSSLGYGTFPIIIVISSNNFDEVNYILNHKQGSMKEIQNAIWYFWSLGQGQTVPPLNETVTWNMINAAKANPNYVPSKGDIMAVIAYAGYGSSVSGVQTTILEYRIP